MASITKKYNKNGEIISYQIRVYRGKDIEGNTLKPYSMTWKPPKDLPEKRIQKELTKAAWEFEERCLRGKVTTDNIRMSEFIDLYLKIMKPILAPTTFEFYSSNIKDYILPEFGSCKLREINTMQIQYYIHKIATKQLNTRGVIQSEGTLSPATVRRYLTVLQSILKQALKMGLITDNPASSERLTLPKQVKPKIEIFTKQEAAAILEALENEPLQFRALIELAIYTGARRGELVGLKFSDIDYENYKITIQRAAIKLKGHPTATKPPKDNETRIVSVSAACIDLIQKLREEKEKQRKEIGTQWKDKEWLFTQWNGEIMNPQTPSRLFEKFLKRHGFKHRKFHALRHTSATLLLYGGINIKQVQRRLGHSDIETTNKYLHYIEEADEAAVAALTNLLTGEKVSKITEREVINDDREAKALCK